MTSVCEGRANRHHRRSWTLTFRSPIKKKKRIERPPTPPPTCQEMVHYPVFNPYDPRHNPTAISAPWIHSEHNLSEESSGTQNTARWMHSLSQKSLRKARSGFLAIKSGMRRHSEQSPHRHRQSLPEQWTAPGFALNEPVPEPQPSPFPSAVSDASTENEHDFGFDLCRMRCNGTSTWNPGNIAKFANERPWSDEFTCDTIPEVDVSSPGLPTIQLEGETLHDLSDEDVPDLELSKQESKTYSFPCEGEDRPASIASTSTSSKDTSIHDPDCVNEELKALCAIAQLTGDDISPDDEHVDSGPVSAPQSSTTSSSKVSEESGRRPIVIDCGSDAGPPIKLEDEGNAELTVKVESDEPQTAPEETTAVMPTEPRMSTSSAPVSTGTWETQEGDTSSSEQKTGSLNSAIYDEDSISLPTSLSNTLSYPFDYEDRISISSLDLALGDEYFYADGKTHDRRPDQDPIAIKSERPSRSDIKSICSHHSSNRRLSISNQNVPRIISPGPYFLEPRSRLDSRCMGEGSSSESADDCFLTYSMFQRRYGS